LPHSSIVRGRPQLEETPYKNNTRKPSNKAATSKRIYRYKAIIKELKHARTKCNYKANAKCKQATNKQLLNDVE